MSGLIFYDITLSRIINYSQAWCRMPLIPALGRQRKQKQKKIINYLLRDEYSILLLMPIFLASKELNTNAEPKDLSH